MVSPLFIDGVDLDKNDLLHVQIAGQTTGIQTGPLCLIKHVSLSELPV